MQMVGNRHGRSVGVIADRHRVVIIGAGFGGLAVARELRGAPVDVTIVDANNFHTFQPLLYQVATAGLGGDDIGYPVRGIFRRQRNVNVLMARVVGVDLERHLVHTDPAGPIEYDSLVVAAGAVSTSFGVPGVEEHTLSLKSIADALAVRHSVLARFEDAANTEALTGTDVDGGALNVVVCGGGPDRCRARRRPGRAVRPRDGQGLPRSWRSVRRGSCWSRRPAGCSARSASRAAPRPSGCCAGVASRCSPASASPRSTATG